MAVSGRPRRMWVLDFTMLVLVLLAMAQQSMQLSLRSNPLHGVAQRLNDNAVSYIGIVAGSSASEEALLRSGYFTPSSHVPYVDFVGRRFNFGKLKDVDVVTVNAGGDIPNVVLSTQLLFDLVNIQGIMHYGRAGTVNSTLDLGDVAVPEAVGFTGNWHWKSVESRRGKLKFGDFNLPTKGDNSLGSVDFQKVKVHSAVNESQNFLWLPVDSKWLKIASQLQDFKLQECVDEVTETNCLASPPEVVFGVRGSTADVYLKNKAYGDLLANRLNVGFVDTGSAAVALTSLTNGAPYIVFRAVSNSVIDGTSGPNYSNLAIVNSVKVTVKFIELVRKPSPAFDRKIMLPVE